MSHVSETVGTGRNGRIEKIVSLQTRCDFASICHAAAIKCSCVGSTVSFQAENKTSVTPKTMRRRQYKSMPHDSTVGVVVGDCGAQ